ncbi:MAG: bifunctional proline dehydrogenase/L-glutamate gamma-semialdehyde dehydrogenase [Bacteriovoracaceae bacterium]|nr:bifunctional proline dehydrogenase/L-glutamate gamma-semialdehyde dehydrogenase [Bacteriovoracaceae bacterium]
MNKIHSLKSVSKNICAESWTIVFYEEFEEVLGLAQFEQQLEAVVSLANKQDSDTSFKWSMDAVSFQFLVGVFPQKREIKIASKNLSYELTLIDFYHHSSRAREVSALKAHAEAIASIPLERSPMVIDYVTTQDNLPDFSDKEFHQINDLTMERTKALMDKVATYKQSTFEKMSDTGLDLTANYMLIRIHLLKFLAILPCLDHDTQGQEIKRIWVETLRRLIEDSNLAEEKKLKGQKRALPKVYRYMAMAGLQVSKRMPAKFLSWAIKKVVSLLATRFIAGESIEKANSSLSSLIKSGRDATLDQLGELVVSNKEADHYLNGVLEIINGFNKHVKKGSRNGAGINRAHVSVKVSALCNDLKPQAFDYSYKNIAPRLKKILLEGKKEEVFINIDAEHYHYRDIIFKVYKKVLLETPELADYADTGIVVQAYLRDGYKHFKEVVELSKIRGHRMPIRLVKGAYWDAETIEADALNFEAPEYLNKEETDIHFRQIVFKSLEHGENIQLAVASHNIQDHCFAEIVREKMFPEAPVIEHQCLHMTYEALSVALAKMGLPTRNYIPIGNLLVGMAYLVRRIMENSSQVGVLTIMRSHNKAITIKNPMELIEDKKANRELIFDSGLKHISREFKNVWPIRTYLEHELDPLKVEIEKEKSKMKQTSSAPDDILVSLCASAPEYEVGRVKIDNTQEVNKKIESLFESFRTSTWSDNKNTDRFSALLKLADLLLIHRHRLTAVIMLEAGKTIDEAVADVDEAIDFINFYVREEINLIKSNPDYMAKGVFGVIAPWNFPLAIPVGMTCAALAAGNVVILKPAEQTPIIIDEFEKLARQAGIDESVFLVSNGEGDVGKAIVDHDLINGVVFTGSKNVGVEIFHKMQENLTSSQYPFLPIAKTVITEMGGKNAIIVTNNCELDETVSGVLYAAFAHAGQKCSAASRIIVDREIKDAFLERFVQAIKDLPAGSSLDLATTVNPVISEEDQQRVREAVIQSRKDAEQQGGRVLIDRSQEELAGFTVGPAVFEATKKQAFDPNSFACKEIFGPVAHVIAYDTLDEAVEIFNATEYALTGGIFCQSQDDIDEVTPQLLAGNLYINRPNTGARVAIEPFGGFKMSGTGPKAGSAGYLLPFHRLEKKQIKEVQPIDVSHSLPYSMVRVSKIAWENREAKVAEYLRTVINRYEIYFSSIDERGKDVLSSLIEYVEEGKTKLETREFPNRYIPGQINFDKRNLQLGAGIMLIGEDKINLEHFVTALFNLVIGNGVNIICANEEGYKAWSQIVNLAYIAGVSPFNISCVKMSKDKIESVLKKEDYDFLCLDGQIEYREEFRKAALENRSEQNLKRIYISGEWEDLNDFDQFIYRFTLPRSFAINTMRHGAPLELTL